MRATATVNRPGKPVRVSEDEILGDQLDIDVQPDREIRLSVAIHVGDFEAFPTVCERCNDALLEII